MRDDTLPILEERMLTHLRVEAKMISAKLIATYPDRVKDIDRLERDFARALERALTQPSAISQTP